MRIIAHLLCSTFFFKKYIFLATASRLGIISNTACAYVYPLRFCNIFVKLFLVSGLTQKYETFHLVCQINDPEISLSPIRILDSVIICYMRVTGTMKHEQVA